MSINMNDPRLQRAMMNKRSKRSMGAGKGVLRADMGKTIGAHAAYQMKTKQSFRRLADRNKYLTLARDSRMAGLKHSGRMLGMREDALAHQKKMLPFHIGGKFLSSVGAGYEGYRRKKDLQASNALKEKRHQEIIAAMKGGGRAGTLRSGIAGRGTGIYGFKATEEEQ